MTNPNGRLFGVGHRSRGSTHRMSLSAHFSRPGLRDVFCVEARTLNMVEHVDEDKHVYAIMYHKYVELEMTRFDARKRKR